MLVKFSDFLQTSRPFFKIPDFFQIFQTCRHLVCMYIMRKISSVKVESLLEPLLRNYTKICSIEPRIPQFQFMFWNLFSSILNERTTSHFAVYLPLSSVLECAHLPNHSKLTPTSLAPFLLVELRFSLFIMVPGFFKYMCIRPAVQKTWPTKH